MKAIYSASQARHDPSFFLSSGAQADNPEVPQRADTLLAAALDAGCEHVEPVDTGLALISAIHTPEYLRFLKNIYHRWQRIENASPEVVPNIHPDRRGGSYPKSAVGQAGYHMADTACPISADTFAAVVSSAHCAGTAAQLVLDGESTAYALCRPPGHHAFKDLAGGFCYLNNSAIAAQLLRSRYQRVAIVDVDLHHGNGTQGIFYQRNDVFTASIHADPVRFYPFFWGYASERGKGAGFAYNLNVPLPRQSGDDAFLAGLDSLLETVAMFSPQAIVVALGLDASIDDPFGGLSVTTKGFNRIAQRIAQLGKPTVLVQEGGYLSDSLGKNLASFLEGFEKTHRISE
ncbi:MAG: histone deacetylase family protein [Gammaproteobacteria bacterium]|nr:histone deacetylase family protein [Gammaproteobacteria bacterium]